MKLRSCLPSPTGSQAHTPKKRYSLAAAASGAQPHRPRPQQRHPVAVCWLGAAAVVLVVAGHFGGVAGHRFADGVPVEGPAGGDHVA